MQKTDAGHKCAQICLYSRGAFFQQASTITMLVIFASFAVLTISLDTFLKLSAWRCPHCKKVMPSDFYSRKTLETCPNCHAVLDFSKAPLFVPAETGE